MTHICVSKITIIGSDNGLSPGRRQAINWTNVGIFLIWPLWTNFAKIVIEIHISSFKKMHLKMLSVKFLPFCLGLNALTDDDPVQWRIYASSYMYLDKTNASSRGAGRMISCRQHLQMRVRARKSLRLARNHSNYKCIFVFVQNHITMTSYECNCVSNHQQLNGLFSSLFRLTSNKTSKPALLALCEGNPPVTGGFPSQRASGIDSISMTSWRQNKYNTKG